ncbi:MAG: hypothetical protein E6K82_04555 [Candidatus Rokuibacteriota bacterium]|nr:MAG: hypothetical protein E6K82_04555 [Candidatus Rokubacteria bacterium]
MASVFSAVRSALLYVNRATMAAGSSLKKRSGPWAPAPLLAAQDRLRQPGEERPDDRNALDGVADRVGDPMARRSQSLPNGLQLCLCFFRALPQSGLA